MAKYDSIRKKERNKLLVEYAKNHPELSLKEIGAIYGISGVRVWVILQKAKERA